MTSCDLIIRNGTVVTHDGERPTDIGIAEGRIVALQPDLRGDAQETVEATGLHIFPGLIDSHVHFNDPGREHWEGIESGSRALAAGGGTMFFDMPLNSSPPTLDAASFDAKLAVAQRTSLTDFALWGGLTPGNLDNLEGLAERGVVGFKAFMANSGIEDFPRADDATLREGMKRAAKLGRVVAVHAEDEEITSELTKRDLAQNKTSIREYLESRPIRAELRAISRAIKLADETKCALHIVHVSSAAGVARIALPRMRGANVTCETCPHYLTLTAEDMMELGAVAKCAPPLRTVSEGRNNLWANMHADSANITTIGSDHSPSPPEMKADQNFFKIWGGISGVQHTLPVLLTEGYEKRGLPLHQIARLTSFNVAERFQLPHNKGRVAIGADADFALVDLSQKFTVRSEELFYRHKQSPYLGRTLTGRVVRTILRGQTVFKNGKIVGPSAGRFVKPQP